MTFNPTPIKMSSEQTSSTLLESFVRLTASSKTCIVKFGAEWCGPCRVLESKLKEYAAKNDSYYHSGTFDAIPDDEQLKQLITILPIDVDDEDSQKIVALFQISSLPHVVFYKNGSLQQDTVRGAFIDKIIDIAHKSPV